MSRFPRSGRLEPPPPGAHAAPAGLSHIRYLGDEDGLIRFMDGFRGASGGAPMRVLALSGGGAGGAFGAGALSGLSKSGRRPVFDMVTGVSTGALIAPFAFVGSDWDDRLYTAYADGGASDLLSFRALRPGLGLYGPEPLVDLMRTFIDDELLAAVAEGHAQGRRLFVATTNLDAEQLNIWDLGAIAASGGEVARELFRDVLVASASLPGIFPPRLISVESEGRTFQEMHMDGGTILPLFVVPEPLILRDARRSDAAVEVYALVNTTLQPSERATPMGAAPILIRSFELMLRSSYRGALRAVAAFCEINGFELRAAAVPETFHGDNMLRFDRRHMRTLFEEGLALAERGDLWLRVDGGGAPAVAGQTDALTGKLDA
jgi:hypothetical protein